MSYEQIKLSSKFTRHNFIEQVLHLWTFLQNIYNLLAKVRATSSMVCAFVFYKHFFHFLPMSVDWRHLRGPGRAQVAFLTSHVEELYHVKELHHVHLDAHWLIAE